MTKKTPVDRYHERIHVIAAALAQAADGVGTPQLKPEEMLEDAKMQFALRPGDRRVWTVSLTSRLPTKKERREATNA